MKKWYVIAIDWKTNNIIDTANGESEARRIADMYDELALRAIAVPEGHPLIREAIDAG